MQDFIVISVVVLAIVFVFLFWFMIIYPANPSRKKVEKKFDGTRPIDFEIYYEYYRRIVVHKKLYENYIFIYYSFKILSFISTILVIYNVALDNKPLSTLFAVLAAIFEGIHIIGVPSNKIAHLHHDMLKVVENAMINCVSATDREISNIMNEANKELLEVEKKHIDRLQFM